LILKRLGHHYLLQFLLRDCPPAAIEEQHRHNHVHDGQHKENASLGSHQDRHYQRWTLTLTDLAEVDSQAAASLREIERMLFAGENVPEIGPTFSATVERAGKMATIDLRPVGHRLR
jgi:hypothetical protein